MRLSSGNGGLPPGPRGLPPPTTRQLVVADSRRRPSGRGGHFFQTRTGSGAVRSHPDACFAIFLVADQDSRRSRPTFNPIPCACTAPHPNSSPRKFAVGSPTRSTCLAALPECFADRYDANWAAKNFPPPRKNLLNRIASPHAVLLFKSLLRVTVPFATHRSLGFGKEVFCQRRFLGSPTSSFSTSKRARRAHENDGSTCDASRPQTTTAHSTPALLLRQRTTATRSIAAAHSGLG